MSATRRPPWPTVEAPEVGNMPRWATVLIRRADRITPGFSERDMMVAWERCGGRCTVSGLPFSEVVIGTGRARKPFAPSLDRIDRARGYAPDNVRLVCVIANFAMNAWGQGPLQELARAIAARARPEAGDGAPAGWSTGREAGIAEAGEKASLRNLAEAIVATAAGGDRHGTDAGWYARQDARIAEAERQAAEADGEVRRRLRGRVAALKRARALGPAGLRAAAGKAATARRRDTATPRPASGSFGMQSAICLIPPGEP
jgi:hypothetical protein